MTVQELAAESVEKSLIGALIFDRDAIASVADRITPAAFATARNRAIYGAVVRCWEQRIAPDITTVHAEMANDPLFANSEDWMQGAQDLADAMTHMVQGGFGCHAPFYADQVVGFARKRAIADAGADLVRIGHQGGDVDPDLAMHQVLAGLDRFGAAGERRGPQTYDELIPDYQDRIMRMKSGEIPNRVTGTGYRDLDRKLEGGFYPGELITLAGRPGMGKTALALNIAHRVARQGKPVLIFSAEMSKESLLRRAASEISGVAAADTNLSDAEFDRFLLALEQLRFLPVSIDDTSGITTAQMMVRVQAMQRTHDPGLVIFDYIELAGDGGESENEQQRITGIVRKNKHIARTCDVPFLQLAQLNRQVEGQANKRPSLHNLRASGSIEQESDKVLFIYRDAYYASQGVDIDIKPGREHIAEVIVAKHRQGATGIVDLFFRADNMSFHNVAFHDAA